jgi:glycosyltransferase involved in cell wall biosynthesis
MNPMKKIAVIHPRLIAGGGSEACALWILEALKNDHSISLITSGSVDLSMLNAFYGTRVLGSEVQIDSFSLPFLARFFDATRGYRVARFARNISTEYDLMISAYNIMSFRGKGIQFIGDLSFDDRIRREVSDSRGDKGSRIYDDSPIRRAYIRFAEKLSGLSDGGWKNNLTIANSYWTHDILRRHHQIDAPVIYPPVQSDFPYVSWEDREEGFVYIGRLSPEKRIDRILEILGAVRQKGHPVHLHLYGKAEDLEYGERVSRLCAQHSEWVRLEGPVSGIDKTRALVSHRYGISARLNEPFGIFVAELVNAGAIVWVPNGGGQREIVDCPDLSYDSCDEAVGKIADVLGSKARQEALRSHLLTRQRVFSTDTFIAQVRGLVGTFFTGTIGNGHQNRFDHRH